MHRWASASTAARRRALAIAPSVTGHRRAGPAVALFGTRYGHDWMEFPKCTRRLSLLSSILKPDVRVVVEELADDRHAHGVRQNRGNVTRFLTEQVSNIRNKCAHRRVSRRERSRVPRREPRGLFPEQVSNECSHRRVPRREGGRWSLRLARDFDDQAR